MVEEAASQPKSMRGVFAFVLVVVGCVIVGAALGGDTASRPLPTSDVPSPADGAGASDSRSAGSVDLPSSDAPLTAVSNASSDVSDPGDSRDFEIPEALLKYSPQNLSVIKEMPPVPLVREFFKNIMVLMMMSPPRYHLAPIVRRHYEPFFPNIYFCGPHNDTNHTVEIHGYDVCWGNEQYRAVSRIMRMFDRDPKYDWIQGYFYISDDVVIQPWTLLTFDRNRLWAPQMGIGNARSAKQVWAVPGMSVEGKFRRDWPYWRKNRGKLLRVLSEAGPKTREQLRRSAKSTHPSIFRWSKYDSRQMSDAALEWAVFYTIVDTYYVPRRFAIPYADLCDIMERNWVFGECAIATMLRALDHRIQTMHVQFYWSTLNAADCPRFRWNPGVTGFHRCRHDHFFAEAVYDEVNRTRLATDAAFRAKMLKNG